MPWKRERYPDNWEKITQARKEQANWTCEQCGAMHRETRIGTKYGRPYTVYVSSAHKNDDPENPDPELIVLCQSCHNKRDRFQHGKNAKRTIQRQRYETALNAGQIPIDWENWL